VRRFLLVLSLLLAACPTGDDDDATAADDDDSGDDDDATNDPCADVAPGTTADCPAPSCAWVAENRPADATGDLWLDGGLGVPALASCDAGWLRLSLDGDGVLVGEHSAGNAWDKCDDDTAAFYGWVDHEDALTPDHSPGGTFQLAVDLVYVHPESGEPYTPDQVDGLRAPLTELDPTTRMVATTADDDGGDWQNGSGGGHEVYIVRADGAWTLLTPGTNGECGGASGWPAEGSRSAYYLWASDVRYSGLLGDVGEDVGPMGRLYPGDLLPVQAYLAVQTGGGVSVGYEERVFRVR